MNVTFNNAIALGRMDYNWNNSLSLSVSRSLSLVLSLALSLPLSVFLSFSLSVWSYSIVDVRTTKYVKKCKQNRKFFQGQKSFRFGSKYSRIDQVKFFKGCLLQILVGPFLNTLTHLIQLHHGQNFNFIEFIYNNE